MASNMSLADFVQEHVSPAGDTDFLVREDLIESFTEWRKGREPIMQLTDLDHAQQDSYDALPTEAYRPDLVVTNEDGLKGRVTDCWVGWKLDWPDGNRTEPVLVHEPPPTFPSPPKCVAPNPRHVHHCFHFSSDKGYDRSQFMTYLNIRATTTFPNDVEGLEEEIKAARQRLIREGPLPHSDWRLDHVSHEGVIYNVFVTYKEYAQDSIGTQNGTPGVDAGVDAGDDGFSYIL